MKAIEHNFILHPPPKKPLYLPPEKPAPFPPPNKKTTTTSIYE